MAKLNHQPFESWLLSGQPLTPEENIDLQEHLRICETCRQVEHAWMQVDRLLRSAAPIQPAAGFSLRWQERLALQRARQQRRQSWLFFIGTFTLAVVVVLLLGLAFSWIWQSPAQLFFSLAYRLAVILEALDGVVIFAVDLVRALPGIPLVGLFFFNGVVTLLCVLWLVAFQQVTSPRRVIS